MVNRKCSAHAQYDVVDPLRKRHLGPLRKTKRKRRSVFIPLRIADALEWDRCKPMLAYPPGWLSSATLSGKRFPPDPGSDMVSNSLTIWKLGLQGRRRAVDLPMQIVCPSCATSYDVEPASRPLKGRPVRCLRCRTVWCAETPCQTNAEGDNAWRNAMPTISAVTADDYTADVNRAAARSEWVAGSNAFELIREQAHAALNAIRSECRTDHNRIISRLSAADATRPLFADKPLVAAAMLAPRPSLADAGWDVDVRIRISRALAKLLAEAANEMA